MKNFPQCTGVGGRADFEVFVKLLGATQLSRRAAILLLYEKVGHWPYSFLLELTQLKKHKVCLLAKVSYFSPNHYVHSIEIDVTFFLKSLTI